MATVEEAAAEAVEATAAPLEAAEAAEAAAVEVEVEAEEAEAEEMEEAEETVGDAGTMRHPTTGAACGVTPAVKRLARRSLTIASPAAGVSNWRRSNPSCKPPRGV